MPKIYKLSMVVSTSDYTEEQMMNRFEKFLNTIPKECNRVLFTPDTCLVGLQAIEDNEFMKDINA